MSPTVPENETTGDLTSVDEISLRQIGLLHPVLIKCQLDRGVEQEDSEEKEAERFYEAVAKPGWISEGLNVGLCEFSAGEKKGDVTTLKFDASYYVAFRLDSGEPSEENYRKVIEQIARVSAWPVFRSLYSQVVTQANEDLPALPADPDIIWKKGEEDAS